VNVLTTLADAVRQIKILAESPATAPRSAPEMPSVRASD
jgi:hypothetical protein